MKKKQMKPTGIWNLGLLYSSSTDPQIEKDVKRLELLHSQFAKTYDTPKKEYLTDDQALLEALTAFEQRRKETILLKPIVYFYCLKDIDADNKIAPSKIALFSDRLSKAENKTLFFRISLGTIPAKKQKQLLADKKFSHFKIFLTRVFDDARYYLSEPEEKILNLKGLPAHEMWVMGNERILNMKSVPWKNKDIPLPQALNMVSHISTARERQRLWTAITDVFKAVAPFSEAEFNAIVTNKKINDELRGHATAEQNTIRGYRNDPKVINLLVNIVSKHNRVAHRYFKLKAKLLKQKNLAYCDRNAKIGHVRTKFSFEDSARLLKKTFGRINPLFADTIQKYADNGQMDIFPRVGKQGGAYCRGSYVEPTYLLLNHTDNFEAYSTLAHELGHAFHTLLSRKQSPIYANYSTSLAETASTLFEAIACDAVMETLPEKEKIVALHDRIGRDVATVFRQIACFNFERDIHKTIRSKGFASKEELAELHNTHMSAYLGPVFKMRSDDGYFFVDWSHLRRFFYVYSYAYGMLVSKALLRRYKKDGTFWKSIEKFLSAGGKDSPENILKDIGIDVASPEFFMEGIKEIEDDIKKLEKLTKK